MAARLAAGDGKCSLSNPGVRKRKRFASWMPPTVWVECSSWAGDVLGSAPIPTDPEHGDTLSHEPQGRGEREWLSAATYCSCEGPTTCASGGLLEMAPLLMRRGGLFQCRAGAHLLYKYEDSVHTARRDRCIPKYLADPGGTSTYICSQPAEHPHRPVPQQPISIAPGRPGPQARLRKNHRLISGKTSALAVLIGKKVPGRPEKNWLECRFRCTATPIQRLLT